jgi:hypothetical protein
MRAGARLSVALVVGALAVAGAAEAQTSASFKLTESTMNNGGDPHDGAFALSASFHLRLDAVGDALVAVGPASAGWHMDAGFVDAYRPPGETANLGWPTKTSMTWNPEASAGAYEVYRSLSKAAFVKALQKLVPELKPEDVKPGGSGVRAQAVRRDGTLVDDFSIVTSPDAIHVLNAPSPAATASLAIGRHIAGLAAETFALR